MSISLDTNHVLLGREYQSKQDAIREIGDRMVAFGEVTARYAQGMLDKEEQCSTWITEGVALPHGTNAVKDEILRDSVMVAQIPKVYLAIGLAGKGSQQHLKLLSGLASVLQHKDKVDMLMRTGDADEVVAILTGSEARS